MENLTPDTQPIPDQAAEATPPPTQTIPAAQLAANRSNFKRSTGPRIPQGKLRSASNSMKHGLYSLTNFDGFIHNQDIALSLALSLPWLIHAGTRSSPRPHTNPNMAPTTNNAQNPPKKR